jgi:predicted nucleotidyltransferase
MEELKISVKLRNILQQFIRGLKDIYQEGLVSIILYGSAVSGEFIEKHSNLNLLVVLHNTNLENLKGAARFINKFRIINPLFLTEDYIKRSTDIFPIEFLDIQENYSVLYGKDILKDVNIDIRNLRFQCEQELKAKLITLRQLYLKINRDKPALKDLLFRTITSILHISRNVLRLRGKRPPYKKDEILKELAAEFQIDTGVWAKILVAKNKQVKLGNKDIESLFVNFISELEKIVDIVDRL